MFSICATVLHTVEISDAKQFPAAEILPDQNQGILAGFAPEMDGIMAKI